MAYRFATEKVDQQDLASGFVLRSAPGFPGFPVRLASEIFQRALARHRQWSENSEPVVLWDALCGSGYLATVLGLLHRVELAHVHASDASERAVELATRNLALLTEAGLRERRAELVDLVATHGKSVHRQAVDSTDRLLRRLGTDLPSSVCLADVFGRSHPTPPPDVVISDVPYGDQTHWHGATGNGAPIPAAIRAIAAAVPAHAVIALSARARKIDMSGIPMLERFRVGLRAVVLVRAVDVPAS